MGKNKKNKSAAQSRASSPPPAPPLSTTPSAPTPGLPAEQTAQGALDASTTGDEGAGSEHVDAGWKGAEDRRAADSASGDGPPPIVNDVSAGKGKTSTEANDATPTSAAQARPGSSSLPPPLPHPEPRPEEASSSSSPSPAPVITAQEAVSTTLDQVDAQTNGLTPTPSTSLDLPSANPARGLHPDGESVGQEEGQGGEQEDERLESLERALDKTRGEKEALEKQYRGLVAKVGTMRDTLGKKLREDAEELDRREAQLTSLSATNASLTETVSTLESELASQSSETTLLSAQLSSLRAQSSSASTEQISLERDLREARSEVERMRSEREEWREEAERERVRAEEMEGEVRELEEELRRTKEAVEKEKEGTKRERERGENLQGVLEEFQEAKEQELKSAVGEIEVHLRNSLTSLGEWKLRAVTAEARTEDLQKNAGRSDGLEKELKEKNLLIGKLRHEAIITTEHLTEALRRLRRSSSSENVDRRLVTNILLSFLSSPRADPKRFEMLNLLGGILGWGDGEREMAGLQRVGAGGGGKGGGAAMQRRTSGVVTGKEDEESAASESFSQLFVEFLLKEATSGTNTSSSTSARTPTNALSPSPSNATLAPVTSLNPASFASPPRRSFSQNGPLSPPAMGRSSMSGLLSPNVEDSPSRSKAGSSTGWGLASVLGRGRGGGEDGGGS